jgi:hypothetical protein
VPVYTPLGTGIEAGVAAVALPAAALAQIAAVTIKRADTPCALRITV